MEMRTGRSDGEDTWPLLTTEWTFSTGADMCADPPEAVHAGLAGQPRQAQGPLNHDGQLL